MCVHVCFLCVYMCVCVSQLKVFARVSCKRDSSNIPIREMHLLALIVKIYVFI